MIKIAIDPDVNKSGVAWQIDGLEVQTKALNFWKLIEFIEDLVRIYGRENVKVLIEAGWLNRKINFRTKKGMSYAYNERIAFNVGSNLQVGKLIEQYCIYKKIQYELKKPRGKKINKYIAQCFNINVKNKDVIDAVGLLYE